MAKNPPPKVTPIDIIARLERKSKAYSGENQSIFADSYYPHFAGSLESVLADAINSMISGPEDCRRFLQRHADLIEMEGPLTPTS